jgi:large subunit ribosomal protein L3
MSKGILGRKLGMTQVFAEDGTVIPVTVIQAGPCVVLQKKDQQNDGYDAIQLGFEDIKEFRANKPEIGHAKKAETAPKRFIKEFRDVNLGEYEVGQKLDVNVFAEGEFVDVTGTSKGKGMQGVIQRHGQSRGPMTHGSRYHRGPGSMGSIQANRVPKGKKLPGKTGTDTVTIQNLPIIKIDEAQNLIVVKGSIPGPAKSLVVIRNAVKK